MSRELAPALADDRDPATRAALLNPHTPNGRARLRGDRDFCAIGHKLAEVARLIDAFGEVHGADCPCDLCVREADEGFDDVLADLAALSRLCLVGSQAFVKSHANHRVWDAVRVELGLPAASAAGDEPAAAVGDAPGGGPPPDDFGSRGRSAANVALNAIVADLEAAHRRIRRYLREHHAGCGCEHCRLAGARELDYDLRGAEWATELAAASIGAQIIRLDIVPPAWDADPPAVVGS